MCNRVTGRTASPVLQLDFILTVLLGVVLLILLVGGGR